MVSELPEAGGGNRGEVRTWAVVAVAVAAQTLLGLDNSILNIALETLADPVRGLGANAGELAWASSSYSLVLAAAMFTGGALGDRCGPRATLITGLIVFSAASAFAALSASALQLIVMRGLMGLGSALLMPATLSIIVRTTTDAGDRTVGDRAVGGGQRPRRRSGADAGRRARHRGAGFPADRELPPAHRAVAAAAAGSRSPPGGGIGAGRQDRGRRPARAVAGHAANNAFLQAMYTSSIWATLLSLIGVAFVIRCFRPDR
jgi:hypothetical protein